MPKLCQINDQMLSKTEQFEAVSQKLPDNTQLFRMQSGTKILQLKGNSTFKT